ncbi:MAG: hypothetical protein QOH33_1076 [Paraburkholderia sp.]|nr:hypothetical protein [Paraburkholderia sp.]
MKVSVRSLVIRLALAAAGCMAVVSSASAADVVVLAPDAPPPVRYEGVPAPRAGYVWDRGHWGWEHGRYVWERGHWEIERVGHRWVGGHWAPRGPHWEWIPGHWA